MTPQDDAPYGIFRAAYSFITWAGTVMMVAILVWVVWTMFMNTSAGTFQSQALETVRPTQTALAELYSGSGPRPPAIPAICTSCHTIAGKGTQVCPSLNEIGRMAAQRIADPAYTGSATTAADYIRESILEPGKYCVPNDPGKVYCNNGVSVMPAGLAAQVTDMDALVAWLATQGVPAEATAEGAADDAGASDGAAESTPGTAEGTAAPADGGAADDAAPAGGAAGEGAPAGDATATPASTGY